MHGHGSCKYKNGDVYTGDWVEGRWHGTGRLDMATGDSYTGGFYKGWYVHKMVIFMQCAANLYTCVADPATRAVLPQV